MYRKKITCTWSNNVKLQQLHLLPLTHNYTIKEHKELWYKKSMKRRHKYHWRQHLGFHTKSHGEEACGNHVKIDRNPCTNLANDIKECQWINWLCEAILYKLIDTRMQLKRKGHMEIPNRIATSYGPLNVIPAKSWMQMFKITAAFNNWQLFAAGRVEGSTFFKIGSSGFGTHKMRFNLVTKAGPFAQGF